MIQVNLYLNHSDSYITIPQADVDFFSYKGDTKIVSATFYPLLSSVMQHR
nr:MAG TPA: hypothetical protein [Caudoviricetes sp.]DAZ40970.1 MAG TPA: hypothetical protein [Caudoviricetes sp.]